MKKWLPCMLCLALFCACTNTSFAQKQDKSSDKEVSWLKKNPDFKIAPFMMVQLWGVYSSDMLADVNADGSLEEVDARFNPHLRRARIGFRTNPYEDLKFTVVAYYDLMGRDALGSSIGGANNPHGTEFGIWDAFFQYKISKESDALHLTGGFFRPQLGRESITSGFATTSGEKAMQQNYIRRHLVGTGPGRAVGVNVGGILDVRDTNLRLNYNLGMFTPQKTSELPNTVGQSWSALWVARAVLMIGDPEMSSYKIGYQTNYYNERNGVSIGFGGSFQDETDLFTRSYSYGFDLLANYGRWNFDTDWLWMFREDNRIYGANIATDSYAGHVRGSYNIVLNNGKILEPVLMWMRFSGPLSAQKQGYARTLGSFSGSNDTYNIGFNYYLNTHRYKIIAHYVIQEGGSGRNQYFSQSALGVPIERSNYFLVGINLIF